MQYNSNTTSMRISHHLRILKPLSELFGFSLVSFDVREPLSVVDGDPRRSRGIGSTATHACCRGCAPMKAGAPTAMFPLAMTRVGIESGGIDDERLPAALIMLERRWCSSDDFCPTLFSTMSTPSLTKSGFMVRVMFDISGRFGAIGLPRSI